MNNATISIHDNMVLTSIKSLGNVIASSVGFVVVGLLVTLSNVLQLVTIAKDRKLRTRCYFLIANLSTASIVNGISFMSLGVKRLVRFYVSIPEVNTKRLCAAEMFTCAFGQSAIGFLPLAIAIDRICAASMPVKYKSMSCHYAVLLATLCWMLAVADSGFSFYGDDQNNLVANCNLVSATDVLYQVQSSVEITISALITVCYIGVVILLRNRMKSNVNGTSERFSVSRMKLQIKVAKTLGIDSVFHLISQVSTKIGLALLISMSPDERFQYAPFIRLIIVAGSGVSLLIFLTINYEFKMAFRRTFGCSGGLDQVHPSESKFTENI